MKLSAFADNGNVFTNCECVSKCSVAIGSWDIYALLPVLGDIAALRQDNYAHLNRIEYLLPCTQAV